MRSNAMHKRGFPPMMATSASSFTLRFATDSGVGVGARARGGDEGITAATAICGGNRRTPRACHTSLQDSLHDPGFPSPRISCSPSSASTSTRMASLKRTLARRSSEYLSRCGQTLVRPLKLGSAIVMRGPDNEGAAGGSASVHQISLSSSSCNSRRALPRPVRASAPALPAATFAPLFAFGVFVFLPVLSPPPSPLPPRNHLKNVPRGRLVLVHQPGITSPSPSSAPAFATPAMPPCAECAKCAKCEGRPHVFTPWLRASLLLTRTRAAQAQDPGAFHTSPPSATSSSNAPAGLWV
mmetsp:Transcript_19525/g.48285  ORF Transcript_19525/g.48285 Transcript_19525/m.48285 type:complete len:297 (+) Transcript_19525:257-1147(+)